MVFFSLYGGGGGRGKKCNIDILYTTASSVGMFNYQLHCQRIFFFWIQLGRQEGKEMSFTYHNSE